MNLRKLAFVVVALVLVIASIQPAFAASHMAPYVMGKGPNVIPNRYIVVYKDDVSTNSVDLSINSIKSANNGKGITEHYRYDSAVKGFAATMTEEALNAVRSDPNVAYVEEDQVVTMDTTQTGATWGLDRINQRALPLDKTYSYTRTGKGVTAFVIDTGIRTTHTDFGGRAKIGADFVGDGRNGQDCNGHGTHVAGTIGGAKYGVAKAVSLVAVRVLNCSGSGTTSGVVAGINWVTSHKTGPAVANMSLGGGISTTLDNAVKNSIAKGVTYAIAGGNDGVSACNSSPARVAEAITVGATSSTDTRASWSNYGSCLDIFAPGVSITSDWYTSTTAVNTISGTSMATPHVAGVTALYLEAHPTASPATVRSAIVGNATKNVVKNAGTSSPNALLYNLYP